MSFAAKICLRLLKPQPHCLKVVLAPGPNLTFALGRFQHTTSNVRSLENVQGIQSNISSLQLKKRPMRLKKKIFEDDVRTPGLYNVVAYATSEDYDLEGLVRGLKEQDLYVPKTIENTTDVVHATAKYQVESEPREIFFFREGSVVMWNVTDLESSNILNFLKKYELDEYPEGLVTREGELMNYKLEDKYSALEKDGNFVISAEKTDDVILEKYAFSNAMALSVKLGIWEASLEKYIDTIEFVTEDLKKGNRIKMSQAEVMRKHGELFALRHLINLSSDLLDTPDFYWENNWLEKLYQETCSYFSIAKRTRVMNQKINHCIELIELLAHHLSDKHHVRLEWMIIILIMVEVGFELLHFMDRAMH